MNRVAQVKEEEENIDLAPARKEVDRPRAMMMMMMIMMMMMTSEKNHKEDKENINKLVKKKQLLLSFLKYAKRGEVVRKKKEWNPVVT